MSPLHGILIALIMLVLVFVVTYQDVKKFEDAMAREEAKDEAENV